MTEKSIDKDRISSATQSFLSAMDKHKEEIRFTSSFQSIQTANGAEDAFFCELMSMGLIPDRKQNPFEPVFISAGKRSFHTDDLGDDELAVLEGVAAEEIDLEEPHCAYVMARVADVLWLKKKNPEYAKKAIHAYKKLLEIVGTKEQIASAFITRPLGFAACFWDKEKHGESLASLFPSVIESIRSLLDNPANTFAAYEALYKFGNICEADLDKYANFVAPMPRDIEWNLYTEMAKKVKSEQHIISSLLELAKCQEAQGDTRSDWSAIIFYDKALQALNNCPACEEREELRVRIADKKRKAGLTAAGSVERIEIPIPQENMEILEAERQQRSERLDQLSSIAERIFMVVANSVPPPPPPREEEPREHDFLLSLCLEYQMDYQGRRLKGDDMSSHTRTHYQLWKLLSLPLLHHFNNTCHYTINDIAEALKDCPLINNTNQQFYMIAKGLEAFLRLDIGVACLLITPCFEASLRLFLMLHKKITSEYKEDGETVYTLGDMVNEHGKFLEGVWQDDYQVFKDFYHHRNFLLHGLVPFQSNLHSVDHFTFAASMLKILMFLR